MKEVLFVLGFLFSVSAFAQKLSDGLQAKNDGNEAFKKKEYLSAINHWEKYLNSDEEGVSSDQNTKYLYVSSFKYVASDFQQKQNYDSAFIYYDKYIVKAGDEMSTDKATIFNIAFTAKKVNKKDVALRYFQKSIDLGYKVDLCKLYTANIFKDSNNEAEMERILIAAMAHHPDSKYLDQMAAMLVYPLLRDASVPFNRANELAKQASSESLSDYISTMTLSCNKFQEAIPLFERVLKYDPKNEQALIYLEACKKNINSFNEYKANPSAE